MKNLIVNGGSPAHGVKDQPHKKQKQRVDQETYKRADTADEQKRNYGDAEFHRRPRKGLK